MINRSKLTILLVAPERLVRADYVVAAGKAPVLGGLWQRQRPDHGDSVSLVEATLRQGDKRPGRTLVLSSDLWTQTVRLAAGNCLGLSDDELSRALGFEAEPLSGIAAFDSMVAFQAMPADGLNRDFWIVQTGAPQVDEIETLVRNAGGRLLAVSHPAGVPRQLAAVVEPEAVGAEEGACFGAGPLTPGPSPARGEGSRKSAAPASGVAAAKETTSSSLQPPASSLQPPSSSLQTQTSSFQPQVSSLTWQRIELWPTAIVGIHGAPGRTPLVHVVPSNPTQRGWEVEMDKWRAEAGEAQHLEWLLPDASLTALAAERSDAEPGAALAAHHLDQDESLHIWLAAWAAEALARAPGVPLVRPTIRPMSAQRRMLLTGLAAAVVGAVCLAHYGINSRATADLMSRTSAIQKQIDAYKELQKQHTEAETKRKKSQDQLDALRDKVKYCIDTLAAHRLRWKRLLVLLSELRPGDLVVQKIDGTDQKLTIHGLCLGPHPANELASNLGDGLRDLEWQVQPAKQQRGKVWAKGEPWKFELVVRDLPAAVPAVLAGPGQKPAMPPPVATPPAPPVKPPADKVVISPPKMSMSSSTGARRNEAQD